MNNYRHICDTITPFIHNLFRATSRKVEGEVMCRVFALIQVPRCCSKTSTFVPNDCSQQVCCVLPIILYTLIYAHLDVSLAERSNPCKIILVSFLHSMVRWLPLIRCNRQCRGAMANSYKFCGQNPFLRVATARQH